jgi:hypothetical protein
VSTSSVKHFATCVAKQVPECSSVPISAHGVSIHNPRNVDADLLCRQLQLFYANVFDVSHNIQKAQWIAKKLIQLDHFDRVEQLTVHIYDDAIKERKKERSMEGLRLVNFKEMQLHSLSDYVKAMETVVNVTPLQSYLQTSIAPVVADWPGQLFIRMAITQLQKRGPSHSIPASVKSFVPIMGPLHVSLNFREQAVMLHHKFFEKLFHSVFGEAKPKPKPWRVNLLLELADGAWKLISRAVTKKFGTICKDLEYCTLLDLLDNIVPAVLDVYALLFRSGAFDEYVETIFRLWTFALRWRRKNYNKAPLAFLSDYFYWKGSKHPFADVVETHLASFSDYFVENMHSKIRANTNAHDSAKDIITQACLIGNV